MRVFLDLNVLLDVLLARPKLDLESEAVLLRCDTLGAEIFIAWHSLATAYYLLRRGRTEAEALLEIDRILDWASMVRQTINQRGALVIWDSVILKMPFRLSLPRPALLTS